MSVYSVNQKALEANGNVTGTSGAAAGKSNAAIAAEFLSLLSRNGIQVSGDTLTVNTTLANHVGNASIPPKPAAKPTPRPVEKTAAPVPQNPAPPPAAPTVTERPTAPEKTPGRESASADSAAPVKPSSNSDTDNDKTDEDSVVTASPVPQVTAAPPPVSQPAVQSSVTADTAVETSPVENPQQAGDGAPTNAAPQAKITAPMDEVPVEGQTARPVAPSPSQPAASAEPTVTTPVADAAPQITASADDAAAIPLPDDVIDQAAVSPIPVDNGKKADTVADTAVLDQLVAAAPRPAKPAATHPTAAVQADTDTNASAPTPTPASHDATAKTTTDLAARQAAELARQLDGSEAQVRVKVKVTDADGATIPVAKPDANTATPTLNSPVQGKPVTGEQPLTPTQPQAQNQNQGQQSGQHPSGQNGNPATMLAGQNAPLNGVQDPRQILPEGQKFPNQLKDAEGLAQPSLTSGAGSPSSTPGQPGAAPLGVQFGEMAGRNQATPLAQAPRTAPQMQQQVMEQLHVQIQKQVSEGKDLIKVQLRPAELGRIEIRMEVSSDGKVMAHVVADNKDTLQLLQRDQSGLEKALRDAGLDVNSNALSFSWRGDQQQGNNAQDGRPGRRGPRIKTGTDATTDAIIAQQEAARAARNRSGVDIKV